MPRRRLSLAAGFAAAATLFAAAPAPAPAAQPISVQDSFRLGSGAGVLCTVQAASADKALQDMFDRAYAIVCRDASVPVGNLYALRLRGGDPAARLAALRQEKADCRPAAAEPLQDLGAVETLACRLKAADVSYRVYSKREGNTLYVAEGLGGYDSALRLGLRTIVADRPVEGEVSIAVTEAGDPAAFARAQAGSLDPSRALAEAYRRNNSGSFAESAEFFAALIARETQGSSRTEALVNQALQQSNLGNYGEASKLFDEAEQLAGADPITARMLRNYRAIHYMNQQAAATALAELDSPLPAGAALPRSGISDLVIDAGTAARLSAESPGARRLAGTDRLTIEERALILDGQTQQLRGTLLRLEGRHDAAASALQAALDQFAAVRGGRVTSTLWMRAQIYGELAAIAEARGDAAEAERQHRAAVTLLETDYPGSSALLSAQARLAGYYARKGQVEPALTLYRQIVDASAQGGSGSPALRHTLAPYFALLAGEAARPEAVADMFKASQLLLRPGVAQTQAVLARELSGGSDDASRLFRQSVNLSRDIERTRVDIGRLATRPDATAADAARVAALRAQLQQMEADQAATQSRLAEFPRYRVLSGGAMTLAELQQVLRPGEAYYKMTMVGDDGYAIFATPTGARLWRLGVGAAELEREVDVVRATISVVENGQLLTYPFDVSRAYKLFGQLFQPVAAELASVRHLIFEPDGAMLRLPPNLLVMEESGVAAYLAKASRPGDDGFDFTDVKWLGRDRDISTAVSARSFRDVRRVAPSGASKGYIGFGENAPPPGEALAQSAVRGLMGEAQGCSWPLREWAKPISAQELLTASSSLQRSGERGAEIVTGAAFTDSAIRQRRDLGDYRILHFATHGLVTAPRPECSARPALMTSFGQADSDGLLSFSEIYDLKIDADLVILSACDTAGKASLAATREAGLATGGDFALDGLVRAFVGAGGRSVIASHWPVPDDFNATQRLISGLFTAQPGTATATALRQAQAALMAERDTSHPYYWSGFAIIGDGSAAVLPRG
jgi:tetratricopeptide (TPR) repeat protein